MADKKTFRINILDIVIVLAIVAVIVGVAMRFNLADKLGIQSNSDAVEISFLIKEISESSVDALVIGDKFYWDSNSMEVGELKWKTQDYAEAFIENEEGLLVKTLNEKYFDVRGTIRAEGKMTDDGFMLAGTQFLSAGKYLYVSSKNIKVTILITDISPTE